MKNSIAFKFSVEGYEIIATGSLISGKEIIQVNNKILSSKRSLSTNSNHKFSLDEKDFEIDFKVVSLIKGAVACRLIIDGKVIKVLQAEPKHLNTMTIISLTLLVTGNTLLAGYPSMLPIYNIFLCVLMFKMVARSISVRELNI